MSMTISFFTNKFEQVEIEVKKRSIEDRTYPVLTIEGHSGFQQEIITVFPTNKQLLELRNKIDKYFYENGIHPNIPESMEESNG